MTNAAIAKRKADSNNVIIARKAVRQNNVDFSNFLFRSKTLNDQKIKNAKGLLDHRKSVQDRIDEMNEEYISLTQTVLNDKTLDFLIQHSNINAPTLTSIFAGFELAKASRADKDREQLEFTTQSLRAEEQRRAELTTLENQVLDTELVNEQNILNRSDANTSTVASAEGADLQREQQLLDEAAKEEAALRRTQIQADASIQRAQIQAEARGRDSESDNQFGAFFTGGGVNSEVLPNPNAQQVTAPVIAPPFTQGVQNIVDNVVLPIDPIETPESNDEQPPVTTTPAPDIDQEQPLSLDEQRLELFNQFTADVNNDDNLRALLTIEDEIVERGEVLPESPDATTTRGLGTLIRTLDDLDPDDPQRDQLVQEVDNFRTQLSDQLQQSQSQRLAQLNQALLANQQAAAQHEPGSDENLRLLAAARQVQQQIDELTV